MSKALLLIPCCKQKMVRPTAHGEKPLQGLENMRSELLERLKNTPELAVKSENQSGILNLDAPLTKCHNLYQGNFYQAIGKILFEPNPAIHILVVSALYGMAKPMEALNKYELQMGDRVIGNQRVYQFWQKQQLWQVLLNYIQQNDITIVWSLLPDSKPHFAYQQVFQDLWKDCRNQKLKAYHVKVPNAGTGTGVKRAQWLKSLLTNNPEALLTGDCPVTFSEISGYSFNYEPC